MDGSILNPALLTVSLAKPYDLPLHVQLTQQLRALILSKRLAPGDRLPSTRALAAELAVSRITVTTAFDQLVSEGYAEARTGAGTFVTRDLPGFGTTAFTAPRRTAPQPARPASPPRGQPDLNAFPYAQWTKLFDAVWRHPAPHLRAPWPVFGLTELRRAICQHMFHWRGLNCEPEQVVIISGLSEAISLVADSALNPGAKMFTEDPCLPRARHLLQRYGLRPCPVPVDNQGFDITAARQISDTARGVLLSPSKQYPLGMTMPLARRLAILNWAQTSGALVLEDDFDGEYRYEGDPVPALMSLDRAEVVIYIGSFSKTVFPGVRLGFLILPPRLIAPVQDTLARRGGDAGQMLQPVMARFINEGHFTSHLRKMRTLYRKRQSALREALMHHGPGVLTPTATPSGMHLIATLAPDLGAQITDVDAATCATQLGVDARPLSAFFARPDPPQGLMMGFAASEEHELARGTQRLITALKDMAT